MVTSKRTCGDYGGRTKNGEPCGRISNGLCKDHQGQDQNRPSILNNLESIGEELGRDVLARSAGKSYGGDRDLYDEFGYERQLDFDDFQSMYERHWLAEKLVNMPADQTWKRPPEVESAGEEDSEFDRQWEKLTDQFRLWHYFNRADRLAGIGEFGVLVIGATDASDTKKALSDSLDGPDAVDYLSTFSQDNVEIKEKETDPMSERFGKPKFYNINYSGNTGDEGSNNHKVHWSRVIHIAENLEENEIYGKPRLMSIYNTLEDIEKAIGAASETWYREANPFWHANIDKDVEYKEENLTELRKQFKALKLGFDRGMSTQGVELDKIESQIQDPRGIFEVLTKQAAANSGIPHRILLGSEAGDLASTQDQANFFSMIANRQRTFAEPQILRQFVDRLIEHGALEEPEGGYEVHWPDLFELNEVEKSQVANNMAKAAANLADAQTATNIFKSTDEMREFLGLDSRDQEQSLNAEDIVDSLDREELKQIEAELDNGDDSTSRPDSD